MRCPPQAVIARIADILSPRRSLFPFLPHLTRFTACSPLFALPDSRPVSLAPIGQPTILPLPWTVFYARLPSSPDASSLYTIYRSLLAASRDHLASNVPASELPPEGVKRESYNLFISSTGMHLIPRRDRLARIPRRASRVDGEEGEQILRLSVNGLLVMGYWYVGTEEEALDLEEYGVERVMPEAAYRNEVSPGVGALGDAHVS